MKKLIKYSSPLLTGITLALVFWAVFSTPEDATVTNATAVGSNLYWGYALLALGVVCAIFSAGLDLICKPDGIKGTLLSGVAIIAIVVVSYVLAQGHDYQIVDLATQGFFERGETVISDASILVAYVAGAGAILAAIYSAVSDALK